MPFDHEPSGGGGDHGIPTICSKCFHALSVRVIGRHRGHCHNPKCTKDHALEMFYVWCDKCGHKAGFGFAQPEEGEENIYMTPEDRALIMPMVLNSDMPLTETMFLISLFDPPEVREEMEKHAKAMMDDVVGLLKAIARKVDDDDEEAA